jgi:hypothetical protein
MGVGFGQIACLIFFLAIKYYPILGVTKVLGKNFSHFSKVSLPKLVLHLERMDAFKDWICDRSDSSVFGESVSEEHVVVKAVNKGYEEYLLDADERAENYEQLKDQISETDLIKLPTIKMLTIIGFITDLLVMYFQDQFFGSCLLYQRSVMDKSISFALHYDRQVGRYFGAGQEALRVELHDAIRRQKELLGGLDFMPAEGQDMCLETYPGAWSQLSSQDCRLVLNRVMLSGELSAVIAIDQQMALGRVPSELSFRLYAYVVHKYRR